MKTVSSVCGYIGIIALGTIVYGFLTHNYQIIPFGFGGIILVFILLVPLLAFEQISSYKDYKKFAKKYNFNIEKKPTIIPFSQLDFYNEVDKIPLTNIKDLININDSFYIFHNTYIRHADPMGRMMVKVGTARNVVEHQLCFLFKIKQINGYHKFFQNNKILNNMENPIINMLHPNWKGEKMDYPSLNNSFLVVTSSENDLNNIIPIISDDLLHLNNDIPVDIGLFEMDGITSNFQMHITNEWVLARMPYIEGKYIDIVFNDLMGIQKKLSV